MATKGTYTVYNQLDPIGQRFSQNLIDAEDVMLRNRLMKQRQQQREQERNQQWAKDLGTSLSKIKQTATGINSVDEMNARVVLQAKGLMREAYQDLKKNPNDPEAIVRIKNLEALPDNLLLYQQKYKDYVTGIQQGIADGSIDPILNRELIGKLDRTVAQNNGYFDLAPDGTLVGIMVDPENDGFEFKPINEVLDGSALTPAIPMADYDGSQKAIKAMFDTHTNKSMEGYDTIVKEGLRPQDIQGIKNATENAWGAGASQMTDFAKSVIASRLGYNPASIDEQTFTRFKEDYANEIINSYGTRNERITNLSAVNQARRIQNQEDEANNTDEKGATKADYLKTQVEGALMGDPKYIQNLVGTKIEEKGKDDKTISDAEFVNGKIVIEFSTGETEEIDPTKDKEAAVGQILKLIRPNQSPDVRLGEYNSGNVVGDLKGSEATGASRIKMSRFVPTLQGISDKDAVRKLSDAGFDGFTATGGWFSQKIQGPNGITYDLKNDNDIADLQEYLMNRSNTPETANDESDRSDVL